MDESEFGGAGAVSGEGTTVGVATPIALQSNTAAPLQPPSEFVFCTGVTGKGDNIDKSVGDTLLIEA
jgi:hypothetical protein